MKMMKMKECSVFPGHATLNRRVYARQLHGEGTEGVATAVRILEAVRGLARGIFLRIKIVFHLVYFYHSN